jgi:lipopolysaccharide cholinephosphotransferase
MVSALSIYPAKSLIYKKTDIEEVINVNLYGYDFYVLKNYDIVLSCVYGDYMKFPPVNERGRWHESMLYNADVPYTEKIKELTKEDNKLS